MQGVGEGEGKERKKKALDTVAAVNSQKPAWMYWRNDDDNDDDDEEECRKK